RHPRSPPAGQPDRPAAGGGHRLRIAAGLRRLALQIGALHRTAAPYRTDSTHSLSLLLGRAPILVAATWPPLNRIIVGMPRTPYLRGVCGFSSILTLATVTRPSMTVARSSRNGATILQGPHHSAQKSTRTGSVARSTTLSNSPSLTAVGFMCEILSPLAA